MIGHFGIICAMGAEEQTTKKLAALLDEMNLEMRSFRNPEPYWKDDGTAVLSCKFSGETVDIDRLREELCALSKAERTEVARTEHDCEISCYNSIQAMQDDWARLFLQCYIVF